MKSILSSSQKIVLARKFFLLKSQDNTLRSALTSFLITFTIRKHMTTILIVSLKMAFEVSGIILNSKGCRSARLTLNHVRGRSARRYRWISFPYSSTARIRIQLHAR